MSDITVTAAQVGMVDPIKCIITSYTLAETVTKGQAVYRVAATGKGGVADADAAGKQQFKGIALSGGGAGQAIDVCEEGDLYGFDLSGMDYDAIVCLSDTVGALSTQPGTMYVPVGKVSCVNDKALTKVLRVSTLRTNYWV